MFELESTPVPTKLSPAFHIPVPCFTLRVREMEIETSQKLGSHTLFIAHTIRDESFASGLQFFMVHGTYQARRQRNGSRLRAGLASGTANQIDLRLVAQEAVSDAYDSIQLLRHGCCDGLGRHSSPSFNSEPAIRDSEDSRESA